MSKTGTLLIKLKVKCEVSFLDAIKLRVCGLANYLKLSGKKITIESLIDNE